MSDLAAAALRLESVARSYPQGEGTLDVFRNLELTLRPGEVVALVGPSGAGKSSLLHMAGLLEAPTSGEIYIAGSAASKLDDGQRTRIRRDMIGFIYQAHHLLPEFTALENVILPQRIAGRSRAEAEANAKRLLVQLGLGERLMHRPSQLSGGEQQRVAVARALANNPRILLADEPTGNLDPRTSGGVFEALVNLVRSEGLAALIATHNLELAAKMDRALVLHEGRLIDDGKLGASA
jgi:lipoprotein-releasing system ATP-binding protein